MSSPATLDLRLSLGLRASAKRAWSALTSARELCLWWLDRAETDVRNRGRVRMVWSKPPFGARDLRGAFVDLEPERKVAWIWTSRRALRGAPPLVSFFLEPKRGGCVLTLLHAGFPAGEADLRALFLKGWEEALAGLKSYLEKGAVARRPLPGPARRKGGGR